MNPSPRPAHPSINIPEIQILAIRHVAERSGVQIPALESTRQSRLDLVPAFVLARQQEAQGDDQDDFDQMRDDHGPDAQLVAWGLRGFEEEGAFGIAHVSEGCEGKGWMGTVGMDAGLRAEGGVCRDSEVSDIVMSRTKLGDILTDLQYFLCNSLETAPRS